MKTHLNTLYVQTDGCYLAKDGQTVSIRHEKQTKLRVPFHNLDSIVCMGRIGLSPQLMQAAAQASISISLLDDRGRFRAAINGFTSGNVLLRRAQYRAADDETKAGHIAQSILLGKLGNSRTVLNRAARDASPQDPRIELLRKTSSRLSASIDNAVKTTSLESLRGIEGDAATIYFAAFNALQTNFSEEFAFTKRTRRPPKDPINCLMSFVYTLLMHDVRSACESTGLDAAVGFLHRDRPGRPGLALDLMEEFRPWLADRLVFSLINRNQVSRTDFEYLENGAVLMSKQGRKTILTAWQQRKQEEMLHPFLQEKMTVGLLFHLQARLLARYLRGDLDAYPPLLWK